MKPVKNFRISFEDFTPGTAESLRNNQKSPLTKLWTDPTFKSEFENRSILKEKHKQFLKLYAEKSG